MPKKPAAETFERDPAAVRAVERMKKVRESLGVSLFSLSRTSGLARSHLYYIEGMKVSPNIDTVCRIAAALGVSAEVFFKEDKND